MNGPSIRKTAALSVAIHATLFLVSLLVLRHTAQLEMPSPYVVTLVGTSGGRTSQSPSTGEEPAQAESAPVKRGTSVEEETLQNKKESLDKRKEQERIEDRLSELAALKKLERLAKLHREMDNIKAGGKAGSRATSRGAAKQFSKGSGGAVGQGGSAVDGYVGRITAEIKEYWAIPDTMDRSLNGAFAVKILKDGTIIPLSMEKSSGNKVFDRLMLITIRKASPVEKPPKEVEKEVEKEVKINFWAAEKTK